MKYKVGDRVKIKSLDWYNENKDESGDVKFFIEEMSKFCGEIMTIKHVSGVSYIMEESDIAYGWTDEMIDGLVEEETVLNKWNGLKVELELSKSVIGVSNIESLHGERFMSGFVKAIIPPEGYQFVDENGNVINTQKIVLEKKKTEYPKTYCECKDILGLWDIDDTERGYYKTDLIDKLQMLLICRDAYWKIAGEEMGLGKPWEPDYTEKTVKYCLRTNYGRIVQTRTSHDNHPFSFPTAEMRDAFYENFKELINECEELL